MELHVFDFDGTIFYSPSPNAAVVRRLFGHDMVGQLMNVTHAGGLGWFQSLSSLAPPAVPADPDVRQWYVTAVLRHMRALAAHRAASAASNSDDDATTTAAATAATAATASDTDTHTASTTPVTPMSSHTHLFVLTGRDAKYAERIAHLLRHAGVYEHVTQVMLKPHETAGTVRHKLRTFLRLVRRYHPRHIYYYEDRPDQGRRLLEGMRQLHRRLHPTLLPHVCVRILRDDDHDSSSSSTGVTGSNGNLHNASDTATSSSSGSSLTDARVEAATMPLHCLSPPLSAYRVLSDDNVAARRAERQAESLLDAILAEEAQQQQQQDGVAADPPPFEFTLVMMPLHVRARSEQMLNEQQLAALIAQLQRERNALQHGGACS